MFGGSGMTEFWIILMVAVLIFVVSRVGDLGKICLLYTSDAADE